MYNGWKNYETWNVALWIQNEEGLYEIAKRFRRRGYKDLVKTFEAFDGDWAFRTPDGVAWNDSGLDLDALDEMLGEL